MHAAAQKLTDDQTDFFEKKIRPVLADHCYKCHSAGAEKLKGGLLLDTRDGLLTGGDSGPALVPGKPEKSILVKAVRYEDEDLAMPPKGQKLSDEQIANLEAWVKMGAPDPREGKAAVAGLKVDMAKAKQHWAFRPVSNPPTPKANDPLHWVQTPIDAFVLARLQEKGLTPSPKADRLTLIRRVTFDLIGLPPTPAEADAFLADKSPDAFAKVVDRLLASPQYGERWGRHWLDIARYADTTGDRANGNRRNPLYPYAWTYRDYVIDAFNKDLPYDQFIIQQVAADRLPESSENKNLLAALGFLTVGKHFMDNKDEMIDDRIDVICKGLMGMTVSCARCHDHKFDPIPTLDYYSLHGVFNSSIEPKEEPLIAEPQSPENYKDYQAKAAAIEVEIKEFQESEEQRFIGGMLDRSGEYMLVVHEITSSGKRNENRRLIAREHNLDSAVYELWDDTLRGLSKKHDPVFAPWFAFAALDEKDFARQAKEVAAQIAANKDPEKPINRTVARAFAGKPPASLKDVTAVYTRLLGDLQKAIKAPTFTYNQRPSRTQSGFSPLAPLDDPGMESLRLAFYGDNACVDVDANQMNRILGNQFRNAENGIRGKLYVLNMTHPGSPTRAMALQDSPNPRDSKVFIRGEAKNPGPVAPRQFVEVLAGPNRQPFKEGSGRLELAKAIASRDNPLTARVFVNRVWQHHFGQAIVRTPSDFGTRSEPPTHPELLDHLAAWFMDHGWSVKQLHRYILLSGVYQQDSRSNPKGMKDDPTNQWLWRMNLQRLDFEEIRDSLLFVGGKLDPTMGGQPVSITPGRENRGSRYDSGYAAGVPSPNRRTVYAVVDRSNLPGMYQTFDFANPDMTTSERMLTTVPQQALFMMNSPFVVEQAKNLTERHDFQAQKSNEGKVRSLYRIVFQRVPTDKELKLALDFLASRSGENARPAEVEPGTRVNVEKNSTAGSSNERESRRTSRSGSDGPKNIPQKSLDAWEQFAQVMLLSNELIFVN